VQAERRNENLLGPAKGLLAGLKLSASYGARSQHCSYWYSPEGSAQRGGAPLGVAP
jgi:hypothetical protein